MVLYVPQTMNYLLFNAIQQQKKSLGLMVIVNICINKNVYPIAVLGQGIDMLYLEVQKTRLCSSTTYHGQQSSKQHKNLTGKIELRAFLTRQ